MRTSPGEEFKPECLNLTVKHLLKIMIWFIMKLDIVDGTVNVAKYIGLQLKCVVLSA